MLFFASAEKESNISIWNEGKKGFWMKVCRWNKSLKKETFSSSRKISVESSCDCEQLTVGEHILSLSFSASSSLTRMHTHTHTLLHTHAHTHARRHACTLTHTHTHYLEDTWTYSHTQAFTNWNSPTLPYKHTHTHKHRKTNEGYDGATEIVIV